MYCIYYMYSCTLLLYSIYVDLEVELSANSFLALHNQ